MFKVRFYIRVQKSENVWSCLCALSEYLSLHTWCNFWTFVWTLCNRTFFATLLHYGARPVEWVAFELMNSIVFNGKKINFLFFFPHLKFAQTCCRMYANSDRLHNRHWAVHCYRAERMSWHVKFWTKPIHWFFSQTQTSSNRGFAIQCLGTPPC